MNVDAVAAKLSVSVELVWKLVRTDDTFPKPVTLSKRATRWIEGDIEDWVNTKKQGENHEVD